MDGEMVRIGTIAARNIAQALQMSDEHIPIIEAAIEDEINALSVQFHLMLADVQASFNQPQLMIGEVRGA